MLKGGQVLKMPLASSVTNVRQSRFRYFVIVSMQWVIAIHRHIAWPPIRLRRRIGGLTEGRIISSAAQVAEPSSLSTLIASSAPTPPLRVRCGLPDATGGEAGSSWPLSDLRPGAGAGNGHCEDWSKRRAHRHDPALLDCLGDNDTGVPAGNGQPLVSRDSPGRSVRAYGSSWAGWKVLARRASRGRCGDKEGMARTAGSVKVDDDPVRALLTRRCRFLGLPGTEGWAVLPSDLFRAASDGYGQVTSR